MIRELPPLVALPEEIEETEPWPPLADAIGRTATLIGPTPTRWLTVATAHTSYLYERSIEFCNVSNSALRLLEGTGKAVVEAETCRYLAASRPNDTAGQRSADLAVLLGLVRPDLLTALDLVEVSRVGAGEETLARSASAQGKQVRTFEKVLHQILGWWSLAGPLASLEAFVAASCNTQFPELSRVPRGGDVGGILDKNFGRYSPRFEFSESGPEHYRWFDVQLVTSDG